jgi:hypothetical protein
MRIFFTLAVTLALAGCTGTETGNPYSVQLALDAHSSEPTRVAVRVSEGGDVVEQAWLVLDPIRFVEQRGCADADGGEAPALGAADHARDSFTDQDFELVYQGAYCRIDVPLLTADPAALPAGAPVELGGASVLLVGRTAAGAAFRISTTMTPTLPVVAVDASGAFAMNPEQNEVLLGFDVAGFLRDVDLSTATLEADGSIIIDATHNPDLLRAFEMSLGAGMELYRDVDGSGTLDGPDEVLLARGM